MNGHQNNKNDMNNSEISLGQALAYMHLLDENEKGISLETLPENAKEYVSTLSRFRNDLNNEKSKEEVFATIPDYTCQSSKPYLLENIEFFIALLIIKSEGHSCDQLTHHLNSCYSCFDIFCQVLRDYFHTTNDIIIKTQV